MARKSSKHRRRQSPRKRRSSVSVAELKGSGNGVGGSKGGSNAVDGANDGSSHSGGVGGSDGNGDENQAPVPETNEERARRVAAEYAAAKVNKLY